MIILKVLSRLLQYPDDDMAADAREMILLIESEPRVTVEQRAALIRLSRELADGDLIDLQERYTDLFDRSRSLSLHLFEHVHGESRDRGQAMVDLLQRYEEEGLLPSASELPDYLPLFLEYLSLLDEARALADLAEPIALIAALRERLEERGSIYASVFRALERLASRGVSEPTVQADSQPLDGPAPDDFEAIDREYAEEPVTFMGTPRQAAIGSLLARKAAHGRHVGNPTRDSSSQTEGRS